MRTDLVLKADDLTRLVAAGVIAPDDRVELLEGEVVWMAPIGGVHLALVTRLDELLRGGPEWAVTVQGPLRLSPTTELYPDVCLVRRKVIREERVPEPRDVLLVVEVSDSTLSYDLGRKVPRYAAAGVPEVWVVDAIGRGVRTHRDPGGDGYSEVADVSGAGRLAPERAPTLAFTADELFGGGA